MRSRAGLLKYQSSQIQFEFKVFADLNSRHPIQKEKAPKQFPMISESSHDFLLVILQKDAVCQS